MCFNARISLTTYIVGMIGSFLLWQKNYKPEALFYFWVIQMQLIEYFIWNNLSCSATNNYITKAGIIINHTEPIVLWLGILYFSKLKLDNWVNFLMLGFIILTFFYTKSIFDNSCTTITKESSPHLHWLWNSGQNAKIYYTYFLMMFVILSIYGLENGIIHAILCVISLGISYKIYGDKHAVGAIWCFMAALSPFLLLALY